MKPEYIRHSEIEKDKWDECVTHSINHLPYCYSWYLDIVSPGWDALMLGNYDFIFPLTHRKKGGINYLYQPYFTQQLGLFAKMDFDEALLTIFLQSIPSKFKFIEINLNTNCLLNAKEKMITKRRTHHLNLFDSYENISRNFNENTRRNLKKAATEKFIVVQNGEPEKIIELFKNSTGAKTDLKTSDYKMLAALMKKLIEKKNK